MLLISVLLTDAWTNKCNADIITDFRVSCTTEIREEIEYVTATENQFFLIFVSNFGLRMKKYLTSENFCADTLSRF